MSELDKVQLDTELQERINEKNAQTLSDQFQNLWDRQAKLEGDNRNLVAQVQDVKRALADLEMKFNVVVAMRGSGPTE